MIPKNKQKLVYLKWQDAHGNSGWFTENELKEKIAEEMCVIEEIGWIVQEDEKEIHLCSRRNCWKKTGEDRGEYGMYQRIPKTWIIKRKVICLK